MRIDSSSIGMESARSFSSATLKSSYSFRGRTESHGRRGNDFLEVFWDGRRSTDTEKVVMRRPLWKISRFIFKTCRTQEELHQQ